MEIKNVEIVPGCISCGTCEFVCPWVFQVKEVAEVKKNVSFNNFTSAIEEAAESCPVGVIKVQKNT